MHRMRDAIQYLLNRFGLSVCRTKGFTSASPAVAPRATLSGFMSHLTSMKAHVETLFDVGVANGTLELYQAFPAARHVLVEPLAEFEQAIKDLRLALARSDYVAAAAGRMPGHCTFHVHPDLHGSSSYLENEDSNVNGIARTVPVVTLDGLEGELNLKGPYLIKLDVQGAELDALSGASRVLQQTECVIMEVSLFAFFDGGPQFCDCIEFMRARGFVPYDIFGLQYRLLDRALSQVDVAFVREAGSFRRAHVYATREQREARDRFRQRQMGENGRK